MNSGASDDKSNVMKFSFSSSYTKKSTIDQLNGNNNPINSNLAQPIINSPKNNV